MSDSTSELPDSIRKAIQERQSAEEERQREVRQREADEAPRRRLRKAAEEFHGRWGVLQSRLRRSSTTEEEDLAYFAELTQELRAAVADGGYADYWERLKSATPADLGEEVYHWLQQPEDQLRLQLGTPNGGKSWHNSQEYLGLWVDEFTREFLHIAPDIESVTEATPPLDIPAHSAPVITALATESQKPTPPALAPIRLWVDVAGVHHVEMLDREGMSVGKGTVQPASYEMLEALMAAFPDLIKSEELKQTVGTPSTALKDATRRFSAIDHVLIRPGVGGRSGSYGLKWPDKQHPSSPPTSLDSPQSPSTR